MASFQMNVIIIAVILFGAGLFIITYMMKNKLTNKKWPPIIGVCPDYWNISDDKSSCVPSQYNLGKLSTIEPIPIVTYNINTPKGRNTILNWTTDNEIMWDGMTVV